VLDAGTGEIVPRDPCDVGEVGPSPPFLVVSDLGRAARDTAIRAPGAADDLRSACAAADGAGPRSSCCCGNSTPLAWIDSASLVNKAARETGVPALGAVDCLRLSACLALDGIVAVRVDVLVTVGVRAGTGALSSPTAEDLRRVFVLLTDDEGLRVAIAGSSSAGWKAVMYRARAAVDRRMCSRAMGASFPASDVEGLLWLLSSLVGGFGDVPGRVRSTVLVNLALSSTDCSRGLSMLRRMALSSSPFETSESKTIFVCSLALLYSSP
jgi:hypothetical protein